MKEPEVPDSSFISHDRRHGAAGASREGRRHERVREKPGQGNQTEQQGDKPAFGQLDKDEGQQGQQEFSQKGEPIEGQDGQKGEQVDQGQQEQAQTNEDELTGTAEEKGQGDQQR